MSFDHPAFPDSTSLEHVPSVNQLEQDRALFVGAKYASYYQAQFEKITPKKQYAGFKICRLFLRCGLVILSKNVQLWLYGHWFDCGYRDC